MTNLPLKVKLSDVNKLGGQDEVALFDTVKLNSSSKKNKSIDEQIIKTVISQKMREDREEEIKEIKMFNEKRRKQWEKALTGKF